MNGTTVIDTQNVKIFFRDEFIGELKFEHNKKIFYLPVSVGEVFLNLLVYNANFCAVKKFSKANFKGLNKKINFVLRFVTIFISLDRHKIKFINEDLLLSLKKLTTLFVRENVCINEHAANDQTKMIALRQKMSEYCGFDELELLSEINT